MKKGFTLIELLAVVLIVAILAAVAVPQYRRSMERARMTEVLETLPAIWDSIERWHAERTGTSDPTFNMLDVTLKGKRDAANERIFHTANFSYEIRTNYAGAVVATVTRGKYKGAGFVFQGSFFEDQTQVYCYDLCRNNETGTQTAKGACQLMGLPTTYESGRGAIKWMGEHACSLVPGFTEVPT